MAVPNGDLLVKDVQSDTIRYGMHSRTRHIIHAPGDARSLPARPNSCLAFSPAANVLAGSSWNKEVRVWEIDARGQTQLKVRLLSLGIYCSRPVSLDEHAVLFVCVMFGPGDDYIVRAGAFSQLVPGQSRNFVCFADLSTHTPIHLVSHTGRLSCLFWRL